MTKKKIVFIGDEEKHLLYTGIIGSESNIKCFNNIQDAEIYILLDPKNLSLIITEIEFGKMQSDQYTGPRAGIIFYKKMKKLFPEISVVLLSNQLSSENEFLADFRRVVEFGGGTFLEKNTTGILQLRELVLSF